jgi:polysaccharide export outer membrane protein
MHTVTFRTSERWLLVPAIALAWCSLTAGAMAQGAPATPPAAPPAQAKPPVTAPAPTQKPAVPATAAPQTEKGLTPPPDYVIGAGDVLVITFWREKDLSGEAMVRPDGRISLPLINDVVAAGLTPEQLREALMKEAQRFVEDTNVTVIVKAINSRWIYITGMVGKPGPYPLVGPTTVLQLIAMAGGVLEYADSDSIVVMRTENGKPSNFKFNYKEVVRQRNLQQNILLKPGDTVVVP